MEDHVSATPVRHRYGISGEELGLWPQQQQAGLWWGFAQQMVSPLTKPLTLWQKHTGSADLQCCVPPV